MSLMDIVTSPWALEPTKLREIEAVYRTHLRGEKIDVAAVEARLGTQFDNRRRTYTVENGVATIPIEGVIAPKANLFLKVSGGTSAQILQEQLKAATDDPGVRAIMLEVDSPGGSVFGVPETAAAVRAAADVKPVVALVTGTAASGGYWIASAANAVFATSDVAVMGSIGVVMTHQDRSAADQAAGIRTTEIVAGQYKRIASSHAPLSSEARDYLQAQVDAIYQTFLEAVASNRGVADTQTVHEKMADGRTFVGKAAVRAGLSDGVRSRDALLAELAGGKHAQRRIARIRAESDATEVLAGDGDASAGEEIDAGGASDVKPQAQEVEMTNPAPAKPTITVDAIKAEHPDVAAALVAEGREEGARAERERISGIEAMAMPGYEKIVADAKADGKSTGADVAAKIVTAQKAEGAERLEQMRAAAPTPVPAAAHPVDAPVRKHEPRAVAAAAQAYIAEQSAKGVKVSAAEAVAHATKQLTEA